MCLLYSPLRHEVELVLPKEMDSLGKLQADETSSWSRELDVKMYLIYIFDIFIFIFCARSSLRLSN